MSNPLWENDIVQFPRLLCEIIATQSTFDVGALAASMDLTVEEVNALFERAHTAWERYKVEPPVLSPRSSIEYDFTGGEGVWIGLVTEVRDLDIKINPNGGDGLIIDVWPHAEAEADEPLCSFQADWGELTWDLGGPVEEDKVQVTLTKDQHVLLCRLIEAPLSDALMGGGPITRELTGLLGMHSEEDEEDDR